MQIKTLFTLGCGENVGLSIEKKPRWERMEMFFFFLTNDDTGAHVPVLYIDMKGSFWVRQTSIIC